MASRLARIASSAALAAVVLLGAAAAPAAAAVPGPENNDYGAARIHWLLNATRHHHGLAPANRHPAADVIAKFSANVQAWVGRLGHNPNLANDVTRLVTPRWRFIAENVGCAGDADRLHALWLASPRHRANALHAGVDTIGIGYTWARGCAWATVVFIDT